MSNFFKEIILFLYNQTGQNLGISVLIISFFLKILLLPFDLSNFVFQQKIEKINPEIKKIQEKYKNDYKKISDELMALYRREKINPFINFLNIFVQFFILVSLYSVLKVILSDNQFNFLFFGIDLRKPSFILALIALAFQLLQLKNFKVKSKIIYLFFGLMFVILFTLPSIILVYWIVNLVLTLIENFIFKKFFQARIDIKTNQSGQ